MLTIGAVLRSKQTRRAPVLHDDINSVLLFAAKRRGDSLALERARVRKALALLAVIGVRARLALGTYKGKHEIAIVCFPGSLARRNAIAAVAFHVFEQESILHLGDLQKNGAREAILERTSLNFYLDMEGRARYVRLGYWRAVSPEQAAHAPASTYVPEQDQFYIAGAA